ncbi:Uncharacterized OsmC-related protein [Propionibacterium cyclohexanicum]|uniref:Uncharacterized OsmC-related protein n=1 Tax=Propionibacterium cyclohexanicum TaxID=64702 RepID=A0A1H9TSB8_9ACTN|nr:OsmC family protein [Propionibacterium cyclohexanicum]SES00125.1 Uncharacterized OsmC-related protein [Propionibacterium cyclohexanicum]
MSKRSPRSVTLQRVDEAHYRVVNERGLSLDFGHGDGLFSPVELLLAAIAGCSSVDVDSVTTRHSIPESFEVKASGDYTVDGQGAHKLEDVVLDFAVRFPDSPEGRAAERLVARVVKLSHDKECTVSRTVELPTSVTSMVDGRVVAASGGAGR